MKTIGKEPICNCVGCGKPINVFVQCGRLYGQCGNKYCRRVDITLETSVLQSLSNEQLDAMKYPDYSIKQARTA